MTQEALETALTRAERALARIERVAEQVGRRGDGREGAGRSPAGGAPGHVPSGLAGTSMASTSGFSGDSKRSAALVSASGIDSCSPGSGVFW